MGKFYAPVLGKRIRATRLDECAFPLEPETECGFVSTNGFITLTLSAEVDDGAEILTKRADGSICVNERQSDSFTRFTLEMEFCGVLPDLLSVLTNAEPYEDYSDTRAGFTVAEGTIAKNFSLELWTGLSAQACEPGQEAASGYLLLPYLAAGVLSDIEVDGENAITFGVTGAFTRGGNGWGVGPFDVLLDDLDAPAPLPTALDPLDHLLMIDTGLAPPPSAVECQAMPSAA